ncbi:MAG: hypothetical protein ACM3XM_07455, partial [Mycobacterium leprae]
MCSLKVVLGLEQVAAIDPADLPTLATLCAQMQVRTYMDQANSTFYVESPLAGKRLVVVAAPADSPGTTALATAAAERTGEQLTAAGAIVAILSEGAPLPDCDLVVRLSPGSLATDGVSVTYSWMGHRESRKLAVCLAEAIARHTAMVDLGSRVSLSGARHRGLPVALILTGQPRSRQERERLPGTIADGIFEALAQFWAVPLLAQIREALQSIPVPIAPPTAPPPPTPASSPDPAPNPDPIPAPDPNPDPVCVTVLDLVPPTQPAIEEDMPMAHVSHCADDEPLLAWPPTHQILGIDPPSSDDDDPRPVPAPAPDPMADPAPVPIADPAPDPIADPAPVADRPTPAEPVLTAHVLASSALARGPPPPPPPPPPRGGVDPPQPAPPQNR